MGFSDREIVTLSGAHNLGRCHADRSGFSGAWVNNPTRFSNQYFRLLCNLDWRRARLPSGVEQYQAYADDEAEAEGEAPLMMLPTDMALMGDEVFVKVVREFAEDKELFFKEFAEVFAKLLELGIVRDAEGRITNSDNVKGGYHAAPKKSNKEGAPGKSNAEADPLKKENDKFRARL